MKYFLIFVALLVLPVFGAEEKVVEAPKAPAAPRYRHIQDPDGKVLATIDTKDGSIDYKEDAKKIVPLLVGFADRVVLECQKALNEKEQKAEKPKKEPKKK